LDVSPRYDALIVGLGAMGSAALYQLARRGAKVLGIDRYDPPHDRGSSHGDTRITRLAIGEGAHYTPLVKRSHEIWRGIEAETGADLLTQCGGLVISSEAKTSFTHVPAFFENTVAAAIQHGIPHERLDTAELRRRFPQFAIRDGETGYCEPSAGFVRPEACIAAQLELARALGAETHTGETVLSLDDGAVTTDRGLYRADAIILAAGAWLPGLLDGRTAQPFKVHRQVLCWFEAPEEFRQLPVFIWELQQGGQGLYGFPALDDSGVKIATEQYGESFDPDDASRAVSGEEIATMFARFVAPNFPALSGRCTKATSCLYTVTPDFQFVVDRHPAMKHVIVASPCSGHGFKHSAAIGEALAALALGEESPFDLSAFRFGRF
jgi:sarcosine oxidase